MEQFATSTSNVYTYIYCKKHTYIHRKLKILCEGVKYKRIFEIYSKIDIVAVVYGTLSFRISCYWDIRNNAVLLVHDCWTDITVIIESMINIYTAFIIASDILRK